MATPPDQIPLLVAALADHDVALGSRIQPDGSDMRATQPPYRRLLGKVFHLLASIWVVGPVKDTQCGFKGFTREAAHDLFSAAAGPQHRLRRRAHLPRPPSRVSLDGRPHPLGGQARLADDAPVRARRSRGLGPVPDPVHPSEEWPPRCAARLMDTGSLVRLGRAALPIVALVCLVGGVGPTLIVAGDTLGYDFRAYHQAAVRVLDGQPLYDTSFQAAGGFGLFYYPPTFAPLILPFGWLAESTAVWVWTAHPARRVRGRRGGPSGAPGGSLVGRPAGRAVVAVRVRGQARAGRPAAVPAVRDRLALAGRPAVTGVSAGARDRGQAPAGTRARRGRC